MRTKARAPPKFRLPSCNRSRARAWMGAGFSAPPFWQTVIPVAKFAGGKLTELKLYPVTLNPKLSRSSRGTPALAQGDEGQQIVAGLAKLSQPFGTQIRYDGRVGIVE